MSRPRIQGSQRGARELADAWGVRVLRDQKASGAHSHAKVRCPFVRLVVIATFVACSGLEKVLPADSRSGPVPLISDSAGVRIVDFAALGPSPPQVRLDPVPYLELGGLRNVTDEEFDPRHPDLGMVELSDGTIVVNDRTRLLYFAKSGELQRAVGSHGSGPAEFNQASELCTLAGDSVLVKDGADGRLSLWDRHGNHVNTWARPGFTPRGGCRPDGTLIVRIPFLGATTDASGAKCCEHALMRPDGGTIRSLGALPANEYTGPLLREPSYVPVGESLWIGDAKRYEVRLYGPTRELLRIIRVRDRTRALSEDEWMRLVDQMAGDRATADLRKSLRARFLQLPRPSTWPAYHRVRADPLGRLWIEEYGNASHFTVFESSGLLFGVLRLPARRGWSMAELAGLAADHIVIRVRDDEGAVRLQFFRLR